MTHLFVPVVDQEQRPLMPTTPARARRWIKTAKATAFWKGGLFCVRLNVKPSTREHQRIAVGIDPGSKKEALVVASAAHTYLNIQANARTGVKEAEKQSTQLRRTRRGRKTPCRKPRQNRKHSQKLQPAKGGKRRREGGTLSLGIKRGTLVLHPKWGKTYVGGTMNGKLSLHAPESGKRLTQAANVSECTRIKLLRWRTRIGPFKKAPASPVPKEGTRVSSLA